MYKQLILGQRYAISLFLQEGKSKKEIAKAIGVHYSTIYREIERNSGKRGYSYQLADQMASERKEQMPGNRSICSRIKKEAVELIETNQWSPKQICGYLAKKGKLISHETIYAIIRQDKKNGGSLYTHCRHKLKHRKRPVGRCPQIPNRTSIHLRDQKADGKRFGDWEMDTIIGKDGKGAIVTLTERSSNFMMMEKLTNGKEAHALAKVVVRLLLPYRKSIKSITTDNGGEFASHQYITKKIGATVFFADPYASWQKGAIENINKLVRQYIPKDSCFKNIDDGYIELIQRKLNSRPRLKLNFRSPKNEFFNNFK